VLVSPAICTYMGGPVVLSEFQVPVEPVDSVHLCFKILCRRSAAMFACCSHAVSRSRNSSHPSVINQPSGPVSNGPGVPPEVAFASNELLLKRSLVRTLPSVINQPSVYCPIPLAHPKSTQWLSHSHCAEHPRVCPSALSTSISSLCRPRCSVGATIMKT